MRLLSSFSCNCLSSTAIICAASNAAFAPPLMATVATVAINGGANAALLAAQIIAVEDKELQEKLDNKRVSDAQKVLEKDADIASKL